MTIKPRTVGTGLALAALSVAIASAPAAATTFKFDTNRTGSSVAAGLQTAFTTTFDDETNVLTFSSTFSPTNETLPNGGWLVLTEGPMPGDIERPIFYLDGINNKVSAYAYDVIDRKHSWNNTDYLGNVDLSVTGDSSERTFDFTFDLSEMNAKDVGPGWKGGGFDEEIGIWYHAVADLDIAYEGNKISRFKHGKQSWFDTETLNTVVLSDDDNNSESVPEPATAAALGVFAVAAAFTKKRSQQST